MEDVLFERAGLSGARCSQLRGVLRVLPSPTFEPAIVDLLAASAAPPVVYL